MAAPFLLVLAGVTFFLFFIVNEVFGNADPLLGYFSEFRVSGEATSTVASPSASTSTKHASDHLRDSISFRLRLGFSLWLIFIKTSDDDFRSLFRSVDLDESMFMVDSFFASLTEVKVLAD